MRTVGIIAEYNPFHTGHEYHLKKAKEAAEADFTVVVMSPDFVQRGEPAVFDKYTRARMALLCGADLVLELPVCYATGSAEFFAEGASALLQGLGVVDALCFGSESGELSLFRQMADVLAEEPPLYQLRLREGLRQGQTFPRARAEALRSYLAQRERPRSAGDASLCPSGQDISSGEGAANLLYEFLSAPNNILGVEYCKALRRLHSSIEPIPVKRLGSGFNSQTLEGTFCSATAMRRGMGLPPERQSGEEMVRLLSYVPENCRGLFLESCSRTVSPDDLLPYLNERLLLAKSCCHILDISDDLSERIRRLRYSCVGKTYEEITALLKTKQMTEARIRRALLHLILGVTAADVERFRSEGTVFYARLLGFRSAAAPLLHEIKKRGSLPLVSKVAGASSSFRPQAEKMWEQDLSAAHLYRMIHAAKYHAAFRTEYEISPIII